MKKPVIVTFSHTGAEFTYFLREDMFRHGVAPVAEVGSIDAPEHLPAGSTRQIWDTVGAIQYGAYLRNNEIFR